MPGLAAQSFGAQLAAPKPQAAWTQADAAAQLQQGESSQPGWSANHEAYQRDDGSWGTRDSQLGGAAPAPPGPSSPIGAGVGAGAGVSGAGGVSPVQNQSPAMQGLQIAGMQQIPDTANFLQSNASNTGEQVGSGGPAMSGLQNVMRRSRLY